MYRAIFIILIFCLGSEDISLRKSNSIRLFVKQVGGGFVEIPEPEKNYVPLVAGGDYTIKVISDSITHIKCRFPNLEIDKRVQGKNEFITTVSIPKETVRGSTFYLNVFRKSGIMAILNFEIVKRGEITRISYLTPYPKQYKGTDFVKPNTTYTLLLEGENMELAKFNIPRFPKLISGSFITFYSQKIGYENKGLSLKFRIGEAERGLITSLRVFLDKETITDINADIVVPWAIYTFAAQNNSSQGLLVNSDKHTTDLNLIQIGE